MPRPGRDQQGRRRPCVAVDAVFDSAALRRVQVAADLTGARSPCVPRALVHRCQDQRTGHSSLARLALVPADQCLAWVPSDMVEKRSCSPSMSHAAATGLEASVMFRLSMPLRSVFAGYAGLSGLSVALTKCANRNLRG